MMKRLVLNFLVIAAIAVSAVYISCSNDNGKSRIFIVTFDADNGSAVIAQSVPEGEKAKRPEDDPVRGGYRFDGWFQEDVKWDFDIVVAGNMMLIAKWIEEEDDDDDEKVNEPNDAWEKYLVRDNLTTQSLIKEMGLGINLGNTLESCGDWIAQWTPNRLQDYETAWGSPAVTEKMIAGYADAGFSSLRIPVHWSNKMLPNYVIYPELLARVEQIVNWTIDCGMVAIINTHHENGWITKYPGDPEAMKKFDAIWTQVSEHFRDYGDRLMFEPMNEVGFDAVWTPWSGGAAAKQTAFGYVNDLNQKFVDIVRASGGNNAGRHLLIEVYNTGLEYAYDPLFKMPDDPANRLAATVHYYTPAVFAILEEDADWGKARTTWGTAEDYKELNTGMENLKKNCVDKGIPVVVGEYAACGNNKTQEMKRLYAVAVTEAVYSRGMCPMLWDTPGGQYNRDTYVFNDPQFIMAFSEIIKK